MNQAALAISHQVFPIRDNRQLENTIETLLRALGHGLALSPELAGDTINVLVNNQQDTNTVFAISRIACSLNEY